MIAGHFDNPGAFEAYLRHPLWVSAMDWIRRMPADQPEGIIEIKGKDQFVNVHSYSTLPRAECFYESHREYVDFQYCIAGGELIEWLPLKGLEPSAAYDAERDLWVHRTPAFAGGIYMTPGAFCIFYPEDGHMPKVSDGIHMATKKLVVKTRLSLLKS